MSGWFRHDAGKRLAGCFRGRDLLQHAAKIVAQLFHLLVTIAGLLCHTTIQNLLKSRRKRLLAYFGNGPWRIVKYSVSHIDRRLTAKRPGAGQYFVKEHTGRENVSPFIYPVA